MCSQLNELRRHLKETLKPANEILAEAPPTEKKPSAADGNGGGPPAAKSGPSEEELSAAKVYPFYLANKAVRSNGTRHVAMVNRWVSADGNTASYLFSEEPSRYAHDDAARSIAQTGQCLTAARRLICSTLRSAV